MPKNRIDNIIVKRKSILSSPLFVLKTLLEPPKTPDKPAPLFCNKITTIREIEITI
jgi:hypothetical protein